MKRNNELYNFARYISYEATRFNYLLLWNESASGEEKQKEILDSIHYAKRIQVALLTSEKYIEKNIIRLKQ